MNASPYREQAIRMGAAYAVPFLIGQIAFGSRTLLKCMYGCKGWGRSNTCPSAPGAPTANWHSAVFAR